MADWNNCKAATETKMGSAITLTSVNDFLRQLSRAQKNRDSRRFSYFYNKNSLQAAKCPDAP